MFFGPAPPGWWSRLLHPRFQHVCAAGCDAETQCWVFYDPERTGTQIEVVPYENEALADARLGAWAQACDPHVLRVTARSERSLCPPAFGCVGAIKALLGVRCWAAFPRGLYRYLLAHGAEVVEVPSALAVTAAPPHLLAHGAEIVPVPRSEEIGEPVRSECTG